MRTSFFQCLGLIFITIFLCIKFESSFAQLYYEKPKEVKYLPNAISWPLLRMSSHHYYVNAYVNGRGPFRFMIDTGSTISVVAPHVVNKLGLEFVKNAKYSRQHTHAKAKIYRAKQVSLGGAQIYAYDFLVNPEPTFISYLTREFKEKVDGILGLGAFYHYLLTLDFEKGFIYLENRHLNRQDNNVYSFALPNKLPTVPVIFKDNHSHIYRGNFVIDTGSNEEFTLAFATTSLPFHTLKSEQQLQGSHYGEHRIQKHQIEAKATWGNIVFDNPTVIYNPELYNTNLPFGLMGVALMKNTCISIDQQRRLIKWERSFH